MASVGLVLFAGASATAGLLTCHGRTFTYSTPMIPGTCRRRIRSGLRKHARLRSTGWVTEFRSRAGLLHAHAQFDTAISSFCPVASTHRRGEPRSLPLGGTRRRSSRHSIATAVPSFARRPDSTFVGVAAVFSTMWANRSAYCSDPARPPRHRALRKAQAERVPDDGYRLSDIYRLRAHCARATGR